MENQPILTPIPCPLPPPKNTQIKVRCFTCKHWPVCTSLRVDYLKTAKLIQEILGDPSDNYLYTNTPPLPIPGFDGTPFPKAEEFFLTDLTTLEDAAATYFDFKFIDKNNFKVMYKINDYLVIFTTTFSEEEQKFEISKGKEVYYNLEFELSLSSSEELAAECELLREELIKEESEEKDIINTTAFSAQLNCDFYEPEKGLTYEEGFRRMYLKYPDGIPLDENITYHLATFHIENKKVPCYNPAINKVAFMPLPYAVPAPPPKCIKNKSCRRDDLSE